MEGAEKGRKQGLGTFRMFLRKSFAVLYTVFFVAAVFSVGNMFVVAGPPPSGDWIVTGTESYSYQNIVLNGNLIVENGGNLTFRGVSLKLNCTYEGQYGIRIDPGGKFYVLEDSTISSVYSGIGYSFVVNYGSTFRMSNSELHECGVSSQWDKVGLMIHSDDAMVENSLISYNFMGMSVDKSGVVIRNNNITANEESGIVVVGEGISPTICDNYISGNYRGIDVGAKGGSPIIYNNTVISNLWAGINPHDNATPIIRNNTVKKNGIGIFSVFSSHPTISNNTVAENLQEGIGCHSNSSAIIVNNTVTSNHGGGISCSEHSDATILGNIITLKEGSGISCRNSSGAIQSNTITSGSDDIVADGIVLYWSSPIIQGNTITTTGTGIWCTNHSSPTIQGNSITYNEGGHGIGCNYKSTPVINNNNIFSNGVYGVCNEDSSVVVNATYNYWGSSSGPAEGPNFDAVDPEEVSEYVLYSPWLAEPIVFAVITNPLSDETVSATVAVSANARAHNGIHRVEFYIDSQLKYTDLDEPYEWNWDTTQYIETSHEIMVKVIDNFGLATHVFRTVFVDNTPPTASIKEPPSGSTCYGTMTISVNATDNREVSTVRAKVDNGAWLIMTYNSTDSLWKVYAFNTTTLSDGQHTLMALALDRAGNPATTSITVLIDNNPPTLSIQSPTSGITVGLTLTVSVQANDISNISRVEFYLHNVLVHTTYTAPFQWAWDTTKYPNGEYTITVKAYDAIGNVKSRDITVTVNNVEAPWWQTNFWAIIQAVIALGALVFGIFTYWSRTKEKRSKKKTGRQEPTDASKTIKT